MTSSAPRVLRWVAFAVAVAVAGGSRAEEYKDAADEAEVQFVLGNDAYVKRDFKQALAHYFASNRLAPNRNVVFNVARAYEQLGQFAEAFRYYQTFRALAQTSDEKQAVTSALGRVTASVALLDVRSTPPGATLYIDRKELGGYGTTPRLLAVAPGKHTFILELAGHEVFRRDDVKLEVGRTVTLEAPLTRILGRLELTGEPRGAEVRLAGPEPVTASLPASLDVTPGTYRVTVTRPGFLVKEQTVEVLPETTVSVDVALERQTGVLVVQADERDALIMIDGKAAGFTPAVLDGIAAGPHDITVSLEGFKPWTAHVIVSPDDRTLIEAALTTSDEVAAASRSTQSAQDAPASVSLVPDREIAAFGATTVLDAMKGERGIYLTDDGSYPSIGFRGFAPFDQYGNRILVQIDGHTVNDDWIGSSFLGLDLMSDLDAVERLELVRGPGSVLYGTGAFFGLVNLVTPDHAPRHPVSAGVTASTDGSYRGRAKGGVSFSDDSGLWLTGGGTYVQPGTYVSPKFGTAEDIGDIASGSTLGRLWWKDLTLAWYYNQREKSIENASYDTVFGDLRHRLIDRRAFAEVRYEPQVTDDAQVLTRLYYDHSSYEGRLPSEDATAGLLVETFDGNWVGAEARVRYRPIEGFSVTPGLDYQFHLQNVAKGKDEFGNTYLDEDHPFHTLSVYTLADWAPVEWFATNAGVRFDGWWLQDLKRTGEAAKDRFLYSVNPRLALLFHPTADGTIKLMGGRAFRTPSIYELTYADGGKQIPSPDLEPEIIWTGEAELSYRFPLDLVATVSVFLNHIEDLIAQTNVDATADQVHYVNRPDATWTLGVELEVARELAHGWMLTAQYSFQRTRSGGLVDGARLANSPEHVAALKVVAPLARPALLIGTRLVIESSRLDREGHGTGASAVWDMMLSGAVAAAHLEYTIGVRNLTGWKTEYPVGDETPDVRFQGSGRTFFADLSYYW
jgi:outer membrane receptor protein involved in Fe transport